MNKQHIYSTIRHTIMSTLEKPAGIAYDIMNRETMLASLTKLVTSVQSRIWLFLLGMTSELVYCFYLLHDFPVTRYFQNLTDMGKITRYSHTGFLTFLIAFSFLFILFGFAWWEAHKFQDRATLRIILSFGCIFALTTIFVYPITALNLFSYIVHSLVMVQHHANPMITPPAQLAHDPLLKVAGGVINLPSPHGPLAQLIQALPGVIAGRKILASLLLFKLMFSAMMMVEAFLVYKILSHLAPKFALPSTLALAWNPFALLEYSVNSHNDIAMMLFIVLAVFALIKQRPLWAMTLITASALIKFASLPLIPLFFIYSLIHQPTLRERMIYTVKAFITFSFLIVNSFIPFWAGPQTLLRSFNQIQGYLYSFSILLYDFSSGRLPLNQAKLIGWALFGVCFLYALWLSSRDVTHLLKGCFLTMFALLAFSATYIQPWYLIWPFVFAILIPQTAPSLAAILFVYGATLAELVHAYIFPWAGLKYQSIAIITNSVIYLTIFLPPILVLLASRFRETTSSQVSSSS